MQDINELIETLPEDKCDEVLRRTKSIPKRDNAGLGKDRFIISFGGKK